MCDRARVMMAFLDVFAARGGGGDGVGDERRATRRACRRRPTCRAPPTTATTATGSGLRARSCRSPGIRRAEPRSRLRAGAGSRRRSSRSRPGPACSGSTFVATVRLGTPSAGASMLQAPTEFGAELDREATMSAVGLEPGERPSRAAASDRLDGARARDRAARRRRQPGADGARLPRDRRAAGAQRRGGPVPRLV